VLPTLARGTVKRTEKGELSIAVDEFEMLTKSLLPLPGRAALTPGGCQIGGYIQSAYVRRWAHTGCHRSVF
jgi:hypothetical protein